MGTLEPTLLGVAPRIFPPPSEETEVLLPTGERMTVPPGLSSARSYASGSYEPGVTSVFRAFLREGMTVADVGANIGYYTLLAHWAVGPPGHVYSFEPDPTMFSYLMRNVTANRCENVTTVNKAVGGRTGMAKFIPDRQGSEGRVRWADSRGPDLDVAMVSMDDYFRAAGTPRIDFVKIDVEGSERSVLEGMRSLVAANPRIVLIFELNRSALRRAGDTPETLATLLAELGFDEGRIIERGMQRFPLPRGIPVTGATYNLLLGKQQPAPLDSVSGSFLREPASAR